MIAQVDAILARDQDADFIVVAYEDIAASRLPNASSVFAPEIDSHYE